MSRSLIRFGHTKIYRYFEVEDPEAAGALVNKRFEGTIIETYKKQGLEVFKIVYDDGDVEEVLWEELQELLEKAGHGAHFETIDGDREYDDAEAQRERIQDSTVILSGDPQPYDAVQDIHEIKDPQRHDAVLDRDENKDDSWQSLHAVPYHQGNITVGPGSPSETLVAPNNISTEISHEDGTEIVNNGYHEPSGVGPVPMDEPGHENEEREGVETELSDVTDADKYISVPSQKNAEVLGEADDLAPMDSDTTESSDDGMGLEPEELKDDSNMANKAIKFLKGEVGTTPTAAKRPRKSSGHAEEKKTSPEAAFSKKKRKGEARGVSGERKGSSFLKESDVAGLLSHPIEQQPSTIGHKTGDSTGNTGQRQPHCSVTSGHHRGRPAPRTGGRRRHVTPSPSPEESRREARPRRPATRPRRRSRSPPWCEDCVSHRELCGACQRTPGVCFRCGDHGHRCKACPAPRCEWCGSRQCRDRDERGGRCAQGFESRLCFVCRKRGHVASTCQTANMVTQRQVLSFLENPYLLAICSKCGDNTGRCLVTCIKEQTGLSAPTSSARERCFGCSKEGHILKVCRYLSQCRRCCLYGHIDIDCDQKIAQGSADTHYPEKYSSLRHQRHSRHRSPSLSESRSQFHSYCRSPARSQFHSRSRSCSHSLSRSRSCSQSRSQQGGANSPGPRSHHGRRRSPEGQRRRRRSPPHCRACRGHDDPCAECFRHRFLLCWNCGDRGHRTRECPAPRCAVCGTRECCREHGGDPVRRVCSGDGARLCFGCGERGHTVAVCPYVALGKGEAPAQIAVCPECGGNGVCGGGSCPAARGNRGEAHSKRKKECVGCRNFLPSNKHGHTLESCWYFSQCQKCCLFGHIDVGCLQSGQNSTAIPVSSSAYVLADFLKDSTQQSDVLLSSGPKGLESSNVGTRQQRLLPSLKIPDLSTYEGTAIEERKSPMPSPMDLLETLGFGAKKLSASKTIQNSSRTTVYHFEKGTCSPAAKDDSGLKEEAVHNATEINTAGVVHLSQPQKVKRKSKKYPTEKKNNATPSSKATEKHNIVVNETLIAKEFPNGKIYTGMVIGYYESKYHVRFFEDSYTHSYSKKEMVELMDETPLYQAKLAEDTSLHLYHDNNKGKSTTAPAQKARERKEIVIGTTRIRKKFKGHKGWFNGIVSSQGTNEGDYKVVYEDGDQEDLSEKDILRLWCDDTTQEPFTPTGLPSLEPCPWKPCEQCQKEQKGGWACRLLGGGGGAPHRGPTPRGADGGPGRPWAAPPHFEEYRRAVRGLAPEILVEHKMDQSLLQIASWDHFQLFCHKMDSHDSVKMPKAEKMKSALAFMNKVFTTADKHAISVKDQHKDKVPADMMRTSVKTAGMKKIAGESKKNQEDQSLPEQPSTSTKDYKIPVGGIRGHQTRSKLNCKHAGCTTRAIFNVQGEQGKFCNRHKHEGMVNVVERTCEQFMCYKAPSFNVQGEGPGRFCAEHKQEGMVNVNYKTKKKCIESGCVITANYGFADQYGKIKRLYCASHRHEGMVLLSNKNKSNK